MDSEWLFLLDSDWLFLLVLGWLFQAGSNNISIKDLKVNLKSVNKKVKNKEEATEKLKNIWEEKMHPGAFTANDYQEIVTLSGGELIDAENLEIKNAKDALELLKIKLKIEEMYMQLDLNNETDIERMINYINEINSEKSKKVIGNHIYVFLMSLLNVKNTVCNYMVIHNNMQNDIENFKAGKFCESLIIEFNENGEIVFPQKYFEVVLCQDLVQVKMRFSSS